MGPVSFTPIPVEGDDAMVRAAAQTLSAAGVKVEMMTLPSGDDEGIGSLLVRSSDAVAAQSALADAKSQG